MPKGIFWSGVIATAAFALLAAAWGVIVALDGALPHPGSSSWADQSGTRFSIGALLLTLPVSALMLRMAARLASRRIFDATVTVFAVTAASVLTLGTGLLLSPFFGDDVVSVATAGLVLSAGFASLGVLSLRSYFEVQSSRVLSTLVSLPLPLALALGVALLIPASPDESSVARTLFTALALTTATTFVAIAIHATRHRQMFLESTGLRGLLSHMANQRPDADDDSLPFQDPLPE